MRTTLDLRDDLMRALLRRHPGVPKARAVERAIEAYLSRDSSAGARALAGRVDVEDVSAPLRGRDRKS